MEFYELGKNAYPACRCNFFFSFLTQDLYIEIEVPKEQENHHVYTECISINALLTLFARP